jgi:hypothetical protein
VDWEIGHGEIYPAPILKMDAWVVRAPRALFDIFLLESQPFAPCSLPHRHPRSLQDATLASPLLSVT